MSATDYKDLSRHFGHNVEVVKYADVNVAIECEDCSEVLLDFDKDDAELNASISRHPAGKGKQS